MLYQIFIFNYYLDSATISAAVALDEIFLSILASSTARASRTACATTAGSAAPPVEIP
jgi:hypothetical protein